MIRVRANAAGEQFWLKRCFWQLMADAPIVDTPPRSWSALLPHRCHHIRHKYYLFWGVFLSFGVQVVFGWLDQIYFYSAILFFIHKMFYCLDVVLKCNHQQHQSCYSLYCWKCVNWDQSCLPIVLPSHQHKLYNCWWNTLDWWRLEEGEGVGEIGFNQIDLDEGIRVQSYRPSHPLWGSGVESLLQCFISWLLHF